MADILDTVNYQLRSAMKTLDAATNQEAVSGPSAPGDVVLAALVEATRHLDTAREWAVADMRRDGRSWDEVATALGISRQAAHKRYAESVDSVSWVVGTRS